MAVPAFSLNMSLFRAPWTCISYGAICFHSILNPTLIESRGTNGSVGYDGTLHVSDTVMVLHETVSECGVSQIFTSKGWEGGGGGFGAYLIPIKLCSSAFFFFFWGACQKENSSNEATLPLYFSWYVASVFVTVTS